MAKKGFGVGIHPYTYYPGTGIVVPPDPGQVFVPSGETIGQSLVPLVLGHSGITIMVPAALTNTTSLVPLVQNRGITHVLPPVGFTESVVHVPITRSRTNRVLAPLGQTVGVSFAPAPFVALAIPAFIYDGFQGHHEWATGTANAVDGQQVFGFFCMTRGLEGVRQTIYKGDGTVPWELFWDTDNVLKLTANGGAMCSNALPTAITNADGLVTGIFGVNGASSTLSAIRESDPGAALIGTNTPGTATNIEFTGPHYIGQNGSGGNFLDATWHVGGWGYFSRDATDPEIIEQFVNTATGFPRFPGPAGAGYLDGTETWEVMMTGKTTNAGAGGAPTTSGSFDDGVSPGSFAPDIAIAAFPIQPPLALTETVVFVPTHAVRRHGAQPPLASTEAAAFAPAVAPGPDPELRGVQSFNVQTITASPHNLGAYTAAAGTNRKFVFSEAVEVDASGSGITGLTWGGVTAQSVIRQAGLSIAQLWEIDEGSFPVGGTGDIVASFTSTGDGSGSGTVGFAGTVLNAAQQAAEATVGAGNILNTITTNIATLTDRALVLDIVSAGNSGIISINQGPGQVLEASVNANTGPRLMAAGISSRFVPVAGSVALGWNHAGTANRLAHALAAYRRAGAALPPSGVEFDLTDSEINTLNANANARTYTYSNMLIGAADPARKVVACFYNESTNNNAPTGVTITPTGEAAIPMTELDTILIDGGQLAVYIADVPVGTEAQLFIDWNNARAHTGCVVYRAKGISSTPHDLVQAIGLDLSASLDVPEGGCAVGFASLTANTVPTWSGLTQGASSTMENSAWATSGQDEAPATGPLAIDVSRGAPNVGDSALYISFAPG